MTAGIVLNLVAVPLLVLVTGTVGEAMFDFTNVPQAFLNTSALAAE